METNKKNKLFAVYLRGRIERFDPAYVIAENSDEAYKKVKTWLDDNKYGFSKERELKKLELLGEDSAYTDTPSRLFI
jgi:hypothetical protein